MKSDFFEFIGNARKRRSETFRTQFYIFLVCLVLSIFIWTLVRLSKDYYFSFPYSLDYTQIPANLRLTDTSDSVLTLKIRVQGFDVFSEQFLVKQERRFEVSLRNVRLRYNGDHVWGYLLTTRLGKEIISQSSFPSDVYFVSPDTLFFEFQKQSINRIPAHQAPVLIKIQSTGRDTLLRARDSIRTDLSKNRTSIKKH